MRAEALGYTWRWQTINNYNWATNESLAAHKFSSRAFVDDLLFIIYRDNIKCRSQNSCASSSSTSISNCYISRRPCNADIIIIIIIIYLLIKQIPYTLYNADTYSQVFCYVTDSDGLIKKTVMNNFLFSTTCVFQRSCPVSLSCFSTFAARSLKIYTSWDIHKKKEKVLFKIDVFLNYVTYNQYADIVIVVNNLTTNKTLHLNYYA